VKRKEEENSEHFQSNALQCVEAEASAESGKSEVRGRLRAGLEVGGRCVSFAQTDVPASVTLDGNRGTARLHAVETVCIMTSRNVRQSSRAPLCRSGIVGEILAILALSLNPATKSSNFGNFSKGAAGRAAKNCGGALAKSEKVRKRLRKRWTHGITSRLQIVHCCACSVAADQ
jgi:hypothetical protein